MNSYESPQDFVARVRRRIAEMRDEKAAVERAIDLAKPDVDKRAAPVREAHAAYTAKFPKLPDDGWAKTSYIPSTASVKAAALRVEEANRAFQPYLDRLKRLRARRENLAQNISQAEGLAAQIERNLALAAEDLEGPPRPLRERIVNAILPTRDEEGLAARAAHRAEQTAKAMAAREQ